jgi:hypothetical protein
MAIAGLLLAVLLLFILTLFHPNYLLYPTFGPHSDVTVIHWPKAYLLAQTWQATHRIPLWTPANLSGMPLAANQLAMRFYPPAWLFLILPVNLVFNLLFVFHLFWGGLGTYLWLRVGFKLEPIAALAGALTFALSGKLVAHAAGGHVSLVGAMAWMPWALCGTHQVLSAAGGHAWRWAALAALALAMQVATHTLITLYTAYLLVAYVIWHAVSHVKSRIQIGLGVSDLKSLYLPLFSIPLLAMWLGAAQLLPLAELAGYSNRALSLNQASEFALTPLSLLVGSFLPNSQGGHEMVIYLGLVPLMLAFWGVSRSDRRSWLFAGVAVLAALFALGQGTPLFELAYRWLPGFRWVRTPARAFLPASLAIAVLVGMGMQRLAGGSMRWANLVAVAAGAFTAAIGLGLAVFFGQMTRAALGLAVLPSLTLLMVGLPVARCWSPRLALPALAVLLLVDLASFDRTLMRFVSPAEAFADGEAIANYLVVQPGRFRTYSPSYSLPAQVAAQADLQTADGVEPVHLAVYDRFMALAGGYDDPGFSVTIPPFPGDRSLAEAFRDVRPDLHLLGLFNVEYLVSAFPMHWTGLEPAIESDGAYVYRNNYVLPRAWVMPADEMDSLPMVRAGDWRAQLTELADRSMQVVNGGKYVAQVTRYEPDLIEVETHSPGPGVLVLGEVWYPGWRATLDGNDQPVLAVAGILRGVSVTGGTHEIELIYDPASVRWGKRLSLAGIVSIIGWGGFSLWRRKRQKLADVR